MNIFAAVGIAFVAVLAIMGLGLLLLVVVPHMVHAYRLLHSAGKIHQGGQVVAANMATLAGKGE